MEQKISAHMYSGVRSPERSLTDEEVSKLQELVSQLGAPVADGWAQHQIGFTGFGAYVYDERAGFDSKTILGVNAFFTGQVVLWDNLANGWKTYTDTPGICAYMMLLMNSTLQAHYQKISSP